MSMPRKYCDQEAMMRVSSKDVMWATREGGREGRREGGREGGRVRK